MRSDTPVHPRLRGELGPHIGSRIGFIGSSPLTRGTPPEKFYDGVRSRFIPAYAGNSVRGARRIGLLAVHPRLRGELKAWGAYEDGLNGSSPLTRGTRVNPRWVGGRIRFIPAYAGNSPMSFTRQCAVPVHPRLRGELSRKHSAPAKGLGSSPLTRGTR